MSVAGTVVGWVQRAKRGVCKQFLRALAARASYRYAACVKKVLKSVTVLPQCTFVAHNAQELRGLFRVNRELLCFSAIVILFDRVNVL